MTRSNLLYDYGLLLVGALAIFLFQAQTPSLELPNHSAADLAVRLSSAPSRTEHLHLECGTSSPWMAAVESDDTDDDDLSDSDQAHATLLVDRTACPSRRAMRMASSVAQHTLNTLNALCVRLQI
jgi:hypothetical protein